MAHAVVVFSGGQDSTTCLYWAKERFDTVTALSFDYNQRHKIELDAAKHIAKMAGVRHEIISMGSIFAGLSSLTNPAEKVEHYTSADTLPGGLEKTFVPGRNILFLTVAANRAYVLGAKTVVLGVAQEDFGGYPDCRAEFIEKMQAALQAGLDFPMAVHTPLMHLNKKATVELASTLPGCLDALAYSHTCYEGHVPPCGHCHACLLRERGFREAGVNDPLLERLAAGIARGGCV